VSAPFRNNYLESVNIGAEDYRDVRLPYSFLAAHPTIREGWQIVHTNLTGSHVCVIRNLNTDETEIGELQLDCEAVETF
jgi:hypothetical protein